MTTSITIGGPLSRACTTCGATVGAWCIAGGRRARALHAARLEDAPPEQTVEVGDLVIALVGGERLAQLVGLGRHAQVRVWRPGPQSFARPRMVGRASLLRRPADDDARLPIAREELQREARGEAPPRAPPTPPEAPAAPVYTGRDPWSNMKAKKGW